MKLASALQISASIFVLATTPNAFAASPAEELVAKWMQQTNFGANVAIGKSTFEPATQSVVLNDVVISSQSDIFQLTYGTIRIEDPHLTGDGKFAAQAFVAETMTGEVNIDLTSWVNSITAKDGPSPDLDTPDPAIPVTPNPIIKYSFKADQLSYDRPVFPMETPTFSDEQTIVEKGFALANWSMDLRADYLSITNLAVDTSIEGTEDGASSVTYGYMFLSGLQNGRVERVGATDLKQTQNEGGVEVTVTMGEAYSTGLDNKAMIDALDPKNYKNGKGDGQWHTVALEQGYRDIKISIEGVDVTIKEVAAEGVRIRQTEKSLVEMMEKLLADPLALEDDPFPFISDFMPTVFGLFGVDEFRIVDTRVADATTEYGHLGLFKISDFDNNGIGAISFKDAAVDIAGEFKGSFELMNFNNLQFGELMSWIMLGRAAEMNGEPTPAMIRDAILDGSPTLDFFELNNVAVTVPEGDVSLTALTVGQGDYLRRFARRYDINLYDLKLPLSLINDPPEARQELEAMGYDSVTASFFGTAQWDTDKGDIFFDDVTLKLKEMGVLSGDIHFGNLPMSIFDKPEEIEQRTMQGTFVGANLVFGNNSIVERTFESQAKKLNQKPEDFRKNFASALPMMLTFLDDNDIQTRFQDVLVAFFTDPKSLVVSAKPDAPLSFATMASMPDVQPPEIMDILNFKIEANK